MKTYSFGRWLEIIVIAVMGLCMLMSQTSCTSTKHFTKSENRYDSLQVEAIKDSLAIYKVDNHRLEKELKEAQYLAADFDSTDCPDIIIPDCPAMLNKDSVDQLVRNLNNALAGVTNKMKVNADGSIELNGRLKQIRYSNEKLSKIIDEKSDSISLLKTQLQEKKVEVKTELVEVEKKSKTNVFSAGWLLFISFVVGFIVGFIVRGKLKLTDMKKLISFFLLAVLLTSCGGGAGVSPMDNITWSEAFNHVSESFSYWLWIIIALVAAGFYIYRVSISKNGWDQGRVLILFVFLALLLTTILVRPSEVAANTTVEQAARGVFIGY